MKIIRDQLREEAKCALTLARSSQGRVTLTMRTHALGMIQMEMGAQEFTDLTFGVVEVECAVTRVLENRKPSYQIPE